jgi:hypothetical protein
LPGFDNCEPDHSLYPQHFAHTVQACFLLHHPLRRTDRSLGKDGTIGSLVFQFQSFAGASKDDRVFAYYLATTQGVYADFLIGAATSDAIAAIAHTIFWPFSTL